MLHNDFQNHLLARGISNKSLKNYKSDLSHFLGWAMLRLKSYGSYVEDLPELVPFLSSGLASEYKNFLTENSIPLKTINRRLSTLRHLAKFLIVSQILGLNFMEGIQNVGIATGKKLGPSNLIDDFVSHLQDQKISKNTIKNYASDVRQFLTWLEDKTYARTY